MQRHCFICSTGLHPIKNRYMDSLDIWVSGSVKITHARNYRLPGYLFVEYAFAIPNDSCVRNDLKDALALATVKAETIVRTLLNPPKVYVLKFGESSESEHFHVIPRTDTLLQKYLSSNDGVFPYNGAEITSWLWKNSLLLGYSEHEISDFVIRARLCAGA